MHKILKTFQNYFYRINNSPQKLRELKAKYNIPNEIKLNAKISKDGKFILTSPDLPGLITQADNHKELLGMLNDAVLTYFDVPKKESGIVFNSVNIEGHGCISYKKQFQTV